MKRSLPFLVFLLTLPSCTEWNERKTLNTVEQVVVQDADSALAMLEAMPTPHDEGLAAQYAMLRVWAQYRNYEKEISEEELMKAFRYFSDSKDQQRRAQVYYLRSVVQEDQKRGEAEEWVSDLLEAAKAVEKTEDHVLAGQIYQRLANAMNNRHNYRSALAWGEKYLNEARTSKNGTEEAIALLNLSMSYAYMTDSICEATQQQMEYTQSLNLARQAVAVAKAAGDKDAEMRATNKLSVYHSRSQSPDSALYYALKSYDIDCKLSATDPKHHTRSCTTVADAFRKMGEQYKKQYERTHNKANADAMKAMADSALKYAAYDRAKGDLAMRMSASQVTYIVYRDLLDDKDNAIKYMTIFNKQKDSLLRLQQNDKVMTLPIRMEKKEVEAELTETRSMMHKIAGAACLLFVAGCIGSVIVSRRHRRQLSQLQDELNSIMATQQRDKMEGNDGEASAKNDTEEASITLVGTTNETLEIQPSKLIYISSEGNYVSCVFHASDNGPIAHKLLRTTMKQIEEQLQPYSYIVRCHRAFMINIAEIKQARTTSAGLTLMLHSTCDQIPVSRANVERIKKAMIH